MSEQEERAFADLVRRAAPLAGDPVFRLRVLERRETEQYRRRLWLVLGLGLLGLACAAVLIALRPGMVESAAVVFFGIVPALAGFFLAPDLLRRLNALRR